MSAADGEGGYGDAREAHAREAKLQEEIKVQKGARARQVEEMRDFRTAWEEALQALADLRKKHADTLRVGGEALVERDAAIEARDFAEAAHRKACAELETHCETCEQRLAALHGEQRALDKRDALRAEKEEQRVRLQAHNTELVLAKREVEKERDHARAHIDMLGRLGPAFLAGELGWPLPEEMVAVRARIAELEKEREHYQLDAGLRDLQGQLERAQQALTEAQAQQRDAAEKVGRFERERDEAWASSAEYIRITDAFITEKIICAWHREDEGGTAKACGRCLTCVEGERDEALAEIEKQKRLKEGYAQHNEDHVRVIRELRRELELAKCPECRYSAWRMSAEEPGKVIFCEVCNQRQEKRDFHVERDRARGGLADVRLALASYGQTAQDYDGSEAQALHELVDRLRGDSSASYKRANLQLIEFNGKLHERLKIAGELAEAIRWHADAVRDSVLRSPGASPRIEALLAILATWDAGATPKESLSVQSDVEMAVSWGRADERENCARIAEAEGATDRHTYALMGAFAVPALRLEIAAAIREGK